jgi:hypothetical protein
MLSQDLVSSAIILLLSPSAYDMLLVKRWRFHRHVARFTKTCEYLAKSFTLCSVLMNFSEWCNLASEKRKCWEANHMQLNERRSCSAEKKC